MRAVAWITQSGYVGLELSVEFAEIIPAVGYHDQLCDVLVIGSGTSGLSTALELACRGVHRIVVVDQGSFEGFDHETRTPGPSARPQPSLRWQSGDWHYAPTPGISSAVGGRSRGWYGVVLPIASQVLRQRWPH